MAQTITLTMAVKDAEAALPVAVQSLADIADEVVIAVDTSSTDNTRGVAEQLGARVIDFTWADSFSFARNTPIEQAMGDWIFWLDSDEFVDEENRQRLLTLKQSLLDENVGYVMTQISRTLLPFPTPGNEYWDQVGKQVRLFRRHPAIRWQLRVFEQIRSSVRLSGGTLRETDVVVRHRGLDDIHTIRRKSERNLRLALMQDAEWPNDPYNLMYIGQSLLYLARAAEAIDYLRRSISFAGEKAAVQRRAQFLLDLAERHLSSGP